MSPIDSHHPDLRLVEDFADPDWLPALLAETEWRQEQIQLFGRSIPQPRLTAWYGDRGASYRYSGLALEPLPWTPLLAGIRARTEAAAGRPFNSVLLNLYRTGSDSVSWHADDEPELGTDPVIASLSLGAVRRFQLKRRDGTARHALDLPDRSLLLMGPGVQREWLHAVPKQPKVEQPRVNLTFRAIQCADVMGESRNSPH